MSYVSRGEKIIYLSVLLGLGEKDGEFFTYNLCRIPICKRDIKRKLLNGPKTRVSSLILFCYSYLLSCNCWQHFTFGRFITNLSQHITTCKNYKSKKGATDIQ